MGKRIEFNDLPEELWAVRSTVPSTGYTYISHVGKTEAYARSVVKRLAGYPHVARVSQVLRATITWEDADG